MRKAFAVFAILLAGLAVGQEKGKGGGKGPGGPPFALSTSAWADGTDIPPKYTQAAGDMVVSPKLTGPMHLRTPRLSCC